MKFKLVYLGIIFALCIPAAMAVLPETMFNNYLRNSSLIQSIRLSDSVLSMMYDGDYNTVVSRSYHTWDPPGWINVTFNEPVTIGAFRIAQGKQDYAVLNITFYYCDNSSQITEGYSLASNNNPFYWRNFTQFTVSKVCIEIGISSPNYFVVRELQLYDQQHNDLNSLPLTANFPNYFSSSYIPNSEQTSLRYIYQGENLPLLGQMYLNWHAMNDNTTHGDYMFRYWDQDPQDAWMYGSATAFEPLNFSIYAVNSSNEILLAKIPYSNIGDVYPVTIYPNATFNMSQLSIGTYHFRIYSFDNNSFNSSVDNTYNISIVPENYTGEHILRTDNFVIFGGGVNRTNCDNCLIVPSNYYGSSYRNNGIFAWVNPPAGWGAFFTPGPDTRMSVAIKIKNDYIPNYILMKGSIQQYWEISSWSTEFSYDSTNGLDGKFFIVKKGGGDVEGLNVSLPPAKWYRINVTTDWPNSGNGYSYAPIGTYNPNYGYLYPGNITYPNGGEIFDKNSNQTINIVWTAAIASEGLTNYMVYYSNDSVWTLIATVSNTTLNYVWNISNVTVSTTHRIKVVSNDSWGAQYDDTSNAVFAIMSPAVISNVQCADVIPVPGTSTPMSITYDVQSEIGTNNLNQSAAYIFDPIYPAVCSGTNVSSTKMSYSCNVTIWYWYAPKIYTANVSIYDKYYQTTYRSNITDCEVYSLLSSQVYPTYLYFFNAVPGANNTPVQEPIKINNTGNVNLTNITVKAYNLQGDTWPPITLYSNIFKVSATNDSTTAQNLTHNVTISINSSVGSGNNSYINLYFWASIPQDQQPQAYSSTTPWEIQVNN